MMPRALWLPRGLAAISIISVLVAGTASAESLSIGCHALVASDHDQPQGCTNKNGEVAGGVVAMTRLSGPMDIGQQPNQLFSYRITRQCLQAKD